MKKLLPLLAITALAAACSPTRSADAPRAEEPARPGADGARAVDLVHAANASWPSSGFAASGHWDDGKAEVAKYRATRSRYGKERSFEATVVHVKEEFDATSLIKSDYPGGATTIPVIKSNVVFAMPTDNYPYNMASGTFMRRDRPASLVKLTTTSHEWCGITTKNLDLRGEGAALDYRSYFESEGDGRFDLSRWPEGGVTEEQLVFAVRDLAFAEGLEVPVSVLSRQLTSHAEKPRWRAGTLRVVDRRTVPDAAGVDHEVWHVVADLGSAQLTYDVGTAAPHLLVRHTAPGGLTWALSKVDRWAYWDFSQASPF